MSNILNEVDSALLAIYYCAHHNVQPRKYRPAMSVREAGDLLEGLVGESRTGSTVHQRINEVLIPQGYMDRIEEQATCPYYLTEKGEEYVTSFLSPVIDSIRAGGSS